MFLCVWRGLKRFERDVTWIGEVSGCGSWLGGGWKRKGEDRESNRGRLLTEEGAKRSKRWWPVEARVSGLRAG